MGKGSSAVWRTILQIALATMLIIGGCNVFFGNLWTKATSSDELIQAVGSLFNGDLKKIVIYVLAAIEILAGIFMILDLFRIKSVDKLDDICVLIIMIRSSCCLPSTVRSVTLPSSTSILVIWHWFSVPSPR